MNHDNTQSSTSILLPERRRERIIAELARHDAVRSDDLARLFAVSLETIRRDLLLLEQQGLARRIFGGATKPGGRAVEPPYEERRIANLAQKQAMARLAVGLIHEGDTVILDVGTSVAEIARALPADFRCRVLTNSVLVATELAGRPHVEVLLSGGRLRPGDLALSGPDAIRFFQGYYADRVFLGSGGVSEAAGLTDYHLDEVAVREVLIQHATERFVLADSAKIGHIAVAHVCGLASLTAVITDDGADPVEAAGLRAAGPDVLIAPGGPYHGAPAHSQSHQRGS